MVSRHHLDPADRAPLLHWLIFTGLCLFAAVLLWHYGLVRQMLAVDRDTVAGHDDALAALRE